MSLARATNPPAAEFTMSKRRETWTPLRWTTVIALIFILHAGLILIFGEKNKITPRAVTHALQLGIAANSDELFILDDPTLFALPNRKDFNSDLWLNPPVVQPPSFRWTEPPRPLPLSLEGLGSALSRLVQPDPASDHPFNFTPTPELSTPSLVLEPLLPQNSTMRVEGALAQRQLPADIKLTNWPYADVIAPSKVQVLVDSEGNVVSTVLLPPDSGITAADQYEKADQRALEIARTLRFTPSASLTFGRVTFNWQTVPPSASP